jgi:hypothetical protein
MLFYKKTRAGILAGEAPKLELRWVAVIGWLFTLIVLTLISVFANSTGWSSGASSILDIVKVFVGAGIGAIYGESQKP